MKALSTLIIGSLLMTPMVVQAKECKEYTYRGRVICAAPTRVRRGQHRVFKFRQTNEIRKMPIRRFIPKNTIRKPFTFKLNYRPITRSLRRAAREGYRADDEVEAYKARLKEIQKKYSDKRK